MKLLEKLLNKPNMHRAYKRVLSNRGRGGIDGVEIDTFPAQVEREWPQVKVQLLTGNYQPAPVRRVEIPKPTGGARMLGIPTLMDRMIQQAIAQALSTQYEDSFSSHSYGFRTGKNAHQALLQAREYVNEGYSHIVDLDLERFFDRVNHDYLMNLLSKRIKDKDLLRLIHRYLKAGAMIEGVARINREGTPQGGPLSPVLSNILLDRLDKELERRGLRFVRYADDVQVFVKSARAAERVLKSVSKFIEQELKLTVNQAKSETTRPWKNSFLGYSFYQKQTEKGLKIAKSSIKRYKDKVRKITSRKRPLSMQTRYQMLAQLNRGWKAYFKLNEAVGMVRSLDMWVRSRIRQCYWKQWKFPRTRVRMLMRHGVPQHEACQWGNTRKGYWRISLSPILKTALTNSFLKREGYLPLWTGNPPDVLF